MKSKLLGRGAGLLLAMLAPTLALAALTADSFRWSRPVESPAVAQTTVVAVPLDAAVLASVADDFRDLRLLNDTGWEVPRAVEKLHAVRQHTLQRPVASQLVNLRELPDNRIEAEFELTATNAVADGFNVATAQRDFQHNVKAEGSSDGVTWTTLVTGSADVTKRLQARLSC